MHRNINVFIISLIFFSSCNNDSDSTEVQTAAPMLSINTSPMGPYNFGDTLVFECILRTDPATGIQEFMILREGVELFSKSSYNTASVDFEFTYVTGEEDLLLGTVSFHFILTDVEDRSASQNADIVVMVDYPFTVEILRPEPSWDLVRNESLNDINGEDVDIFLYREVTPANQLTAFVSKNATRFYNITDPSINFFNKKITTDQVFQLSRTLIKLIR